MSGLEALFEEHAAAAFDKQLALGELVGDLPWSFQLASGRLTFGDRLGFQTQILGTESESSETWLWAWANEESGIPESLLAASLELRALGERERIEALTEPSLPLDAADGHRLSMIASGVCKGDAYYRGPYDGGALFVLIKDPAYRRPAVHPTVRILTVFPQLVSAFELDHRRAWLGYLRHYGAAIEERGDRVQGTIRGGDPVAARFDRQGRMVELEGTAIP